MPELVPVDHDPWAEAQTHQAERPNPAAPIVNFGKLFAKTVADRAVSAITAPRDAFTGAMRVTDPETGMPTQEAMQRGQGVANLAMTGGIPFAKAGAAGMAGGKLTQPEGITAYHGSPHDFDRFDLSKIGTGEGAQAYGHGLYFAENPSVAEDYRKALTNVTFGGRPWDRSNPLQTASTFVFQHGSREKALAETEKDLSRASHWEDMDHLQRVVSALKTDKPLPKIDAPGKVYQVAIKAPPEHFLDWDKPLSEQSPKVREALEPFRQAVIKDRQTNNPSIGDVTHTSEVIAGAPDQAAMSKALREAGIPGIKYLDQGSRFAGTQGAAHLRNQISQLEDMAKASPGREDIKSALTQRKAELKAAESGTHNYVVFDDKLIDILKKYGIAGLAALPAAGGYHFRTQQVDHDPFGQ